MEGTGVLIIHCSAVTGLEQLIKLVISHLEITPACLGNIGGIRLVKHIIAVLTILNPQTQTELGIAPDIVVHCTAGLLGCQNQMNSQAPPYLSHADQLLHKV